MEEVRDRSHSRLTAQVKESPEEKADAKGDDDCQGIECQPFRADEHDRVPLISFESMERMERAKEP